MPGFCGLDTFLHLPGLLVVTQDQTQEVRSKDGWEGVG